MSITTDFKTLWTETKQRERTVEAKAKLQNAMNVIEETKAQIQEIVNEGSLNTIPNSIKVALNQAFTVVKTASTGFNTPDIQEVLGWSGT
jgi:hypothetical protein